MGAVEWGPAGVDANWVWIGLRRGGVGRERCGGEDALDDAGGLSGGVEGSIG